MSGNHALHAEASLMHALIPRINCRLLINEERESEYNVIFYQLIIDDKYTSAYHNSGPKGKV